MNQVHRRSALPETGPPWVTLFHGAIAIFGWLLFAYFWRVVTRVGLSAGAKAALLAMVIFLSILLVLTVWWIAHNLSIGRRDRRRGNRDLVEKLYLFDAVGMRVEMPDHARMKSASVIEITIDESHKTYRAMAEGRSDKSVTS
jgi:hypothetical protein